MKFTTKQQDAIKKCVRDLSPYFSIQNWTARFNFAEDTVDYASIDVRPKYRDFLLTINSCLLDDKEEAFATIVHELSHIVQAQTYMQLRSIIRDGEFVSKTDIIDSYEHSTEWMTLMLISFMNNPHQPAEWQKIKKTLEMGIA